MKTFKREKFSSFAKNFTVEAKEKVLRYASERFVAIGIRNVTMDELAADLGMSKRTIYELFGQKDKLVLESIHFMIMNEHLHMKQVIEESDHVVEALFLILRRKKEVSRSYPKVFIEDIKKYLPRVHAMFYADREALKKYSASFILLEKGIREKIFRQDLHVELVDNFLQEMISLIHNSPRILSFQPTDTDLLNNIFIPYFRGICTTKGLQLMDKFFESQQESA